MYTAGRASGAAALRAAEARVAELESYATLLHVMDPNDETAGRLRAEGAAAERARIVAWLRAYADDFIIETLCLRLAEAIERGAADEGSNGTRSAP